MRNDEITPVENETKRRHAIRRKTPREKTTKLVSNGVFSHGVFFSCLRAEILSCRAASLRDEMTKLQYNRLL